MKAPEKTGRGYDELADGRTPDVFQPLYTIAALHASPARELSTSVEPLITTPIAFASVLPSVITSMDEFIAVNCTT